MRCCCARSPSSAPRRSSGSTPASRSEEHTSELQSRQYLVCRLLLEKKKTTYTIILYLYPPTIKSLLILKFISTSDFYIDLSFDTAILLFIFLYYSIVADCLVYPEKS